MARPKKRPSDADPPTQPSLLLAEKLAHRERAIAGTSTDEAPTLEGLPVIKRLAAAEKKRARKKR